MSAIADPLNGLRVLIVEDETLVAMLIEEYLLEMGCEVAFSASRIAKAFKGLQTSRIDVAVLDVNVAGESISQLVDVLHQRGIFRTLATADEGRRNGENIRRKSEPRLLDNCAALVICYRSV